MSSDHSIEDCITQLEKLGLNENQMIDHISDYFKKKNIDKRDVFWQCVEDLRALDKDEKLDRKILVKELKLSVRFYY